MERNCHSCDSVCAAQARKRFYGWEGEGRGGEKGQIEWAGVHLAVRFRKWNARANGNLNNVCAPSGFRKKREERGKGEEEKKELDTFHLLTRN